VIGIAFASILSLAAALAEDPASVGKRIYQEGILPDGRPLKARVEGDLQAEGPQFSCVRCHRRSGMGSTEGAVRVPPITAEALFAPTELRRSDIIGPLFEQRQPIQLRAHLWQLPTRPAYSDRTLARALRQGIDPAGRELNPAMPRYALSDEDATQLLAYLKSLSQRNPAGVNGDTIHFATIFDEGANTQERQAMLAVMDAYVQRHNRKTGNERQGKQVRAVLAGDPALPNRQWVLDVWDLKGSSQEWENQLEALYRQQPVLAILGGIVSKSYKAVARFCDRTGTPCLFPETLLPDNPSPDSYSIYFTGGIESEAEALGKFLARGPDGRKITQVYRETEFGTAAATALQNSVQKAGVLVHSVPVRRDHSPTSDFWSELSKKSPSSDLVLWLQDEDLMALPPALGNTPRVYLSYRLVKHPAAVPLPHSNSYFVCPFSLPRDAAPEAAHIRGRLLADHITVQDPRVQFDTYFMLSLVDYSLESMAGRISGDYLLEAIERETETAPNPGIFPRLSLGPGQRFASKGDRIVRFDSRGDLEAVSEWIVP
jgi:ABC-type branched-subunit amino acid transport system substrate-binding protein